VRLAPLLDEAAARWGDLHGHPQRRTAERHVAGLDLRITVVGDELGELAFRALDGLGPTRGPVTAEIGAWDATATGVPIPVVPEGAPAGLRWTATRDGEAIVEVAVLEDGSIRFADRDARRFLLGVPDVASLSSWERGAPLRRQLLWALWPEAQLVHAAAVATDDGVALLSGPSGSGKSSTAVACALAGMGYLGDDHCAVTPGSPFTAHLLHLSARLVEHETAFLSAMDGRGATADVDKVLVWPSGLGSTVERSGPIRTLLLLEPEGAAAPRLEPLRASEALRRIAPSMLRQQHVAPDRELSRMRDLLSELPLSRLVLAADRTANPPVIAEAIAGARG
jgi:hypothetical protein